MLSKQICLEKESPYYSADLFDFEELKSKKLLGKTIPLGICGKGEFVGEEALFKSKQEFDFSVESASKSATLMAIKISALKALPGRYTEVWRLIFKQKQEFRISQFQRTLSVLLEKQKGARIDLFGNFIKSPTLLENESTSENALNDNIVRFKKALAVSDRIGIMAKKFESMKKGFVVSDVKDLPYFTYDVREEKRISKQNFLPKISPRRDLWKIKKTVKEATNERMRRAESICSFVTVKKVNSNSLEKQAFSFDLR